jgi:transcriptional regulator with XRE-family HTH domain
VKYPRLRRGRELSGLSGVQAAKLLGIRSQKIGQYEVGEVVPAAKMLKDMANVYGCSRAWLEGQDVAVSDSTKQLLRDDRISFSDRDAIEEILSSMEKHVID